MAAALAIENKRSSHHRGDWSDCAHDMLLKVFNPVRNRTPTAILIAAALKKGSTPRAKAWLRPTYADSHSMPTPDIMHCPAVNAMSLYTTDDCGRFSISLPMRYAAGMKDKRKPALGPINHSGWTRPFAKTGSPKLP